MTAALEERLTEALIKIAFLCPPCQRRHCEECIGCIVGKALASIPKVQ
jgi:hypothetical protein